jgi:glycosyltransferase involved in cell wall biosynthesis
MASCPLTVPSPAHKPLTIGIDARAATEVPAGRGRVVRELLRELAARDDPHTYICYARVPWEEPLGERFLWRCRPASDGAWHIWSALDASRSCDVYLATNSYLSVIFNLLPTVAIVYDLVAFEPGLGTRRQSLVVERLTLGIAARRARGLVCISSSTRSALTARYPATSDISTVALLGTADSLVGPGAAELDELPAPGFVLAVGTLEPRKNLPRLVAGYAALPAARQRDHPLVVVGASGWQTGETSAALDSLGDRCLRLGHVSDAALAELYRRCAVFCYTSLSEGFGLPVLEAMAAGAAVITSSVSSLPEVGGDAVEYVDPLSVDSISERLHDLLSSPERRAELGRLGSERARLFSWGRTADAVMTALERAAYPG